MSVTATEVLSRVKALVDPALRRAVSSLSEQLRPPVEYHLGWVDKSGSPLSTDGGKGIRPAFAILSAEVVGASAEIGLPGAVGVELVHNFSLIHDDVIDGDVERRHRETVWSLYGVGRAVVAGDALLTLAQQVILDPSMTLGPTAISNPEYAARAALHLADATAEMNSGQALDMEFESHRSVTYEECLRMEGGKTGALLSCAASIGAVLAGADRKTVDALGVFGMQLGLSFQAVDDLLGVWGDPARTGKATYADLRQHKKTLPVTAAIESGGRRARELEDLLEIPELSDDEVARAAKLVEELGGRARASAQARESMENALAALDEASSNDTARAELVELAHFVVDREF